MATGSRDWKPEALAISSVLHGIAPREFPGPAYQIYNTRKPAPADLPRKTFLNEFKHFLSFRACFRQ